jgi:hypothetical protein
MDKATVAPGASRYKGRKARTNRGKFGSLELRYWRGDLTEEEAESFERLVYLMHTLYKGVV